MPKLSDVKETALYVDDLSRATRFYQEVLGLAVLVDHERFVALDVAGRHILLLFLRGASLHETHLPVGTIPPHDGSGALHIGFSIESAELPVWQAHLALHGVPVISEVTWPAGGRSVYFHDPDGHVLELLTPGVWRTY